MHELLTIAQMRQAEALAIASGITSLELMENAGRAVAEVTMSIDPGRPVVIVTGPGNNGGDGFVVARLLQQRGCPVRVVALCEPGRLRGDAAIMAGRFTGQVAAWDGRAAFGPEALIVDAVFGCGLTRPVEGRFAAAIEMMNRSPAPVIAVDIPSGINADSGEVMAGAAGTAVPAADPAVRAADRAVRVSDTAVRAAYTVSFFRRRPGHLLFPGRFYCGQLRIAENIGIPAAVLDVIKPQLALNDPERWAACFPRPQPESHKYVRGHAVVLSGGIASTGAARLAARAALRAGAGLVTIASPRDALAVNAAASLTVMVREAEGVDGWTSVLSDPRINAVIAGPGGGVGSEMRHKIRAAAARERALVLDADALTSFGENPQELFTILANHKLSTAILTPHEGEFSRLFSSIETIPSVKQKLEATISASHETAAVVLLKGADTVVASPDGRAVIADNGPPYLATAGAGDVLAGIVGGLRAQGMPAFEAAAAAVWIHGEAAHVVGRGLISEDLIEALPMVYRRLFARLARRSL